MSATRFADEYRILTNYSHDKALIEKENQGQKKSSMQKQVRFTDARYIINGDEISIEERKSLWYRSDDLSLIRSEARKCLLELRRNGGTESKVDDKENCMLGLEAYFEYQRPLTKQTVRKQHVKNILALQRAQISEKSSDASVLAVVASTLSRSARNRARDRAEQITF